jgi:hypothetical protein
MERGTVTRTTSGTIAVLSGCALLVVLEVMR